MSAGVIDEPTGPLSVFVSREFRACIRDLMAGKDRLVDDVIDGADIEDAAARFRTEILDELNALRGSVLAALQPVDDPSMQYALDALEALGKVFAAHLDRGD